MSDIVLGGDVENTPVELIKDSDTEQFSADVIETSKQVPVIVDFWAPWCGPCKQLGPDIEQAVIAAKGRVKLVKINVDENQQLASQMRVQSIPAVFAFHEGRPVDGFVGGLPKSQIEEFVAKMAALGPNDDVEEALEQAQAALDNDDLLGAAQIFAKVVQHQNDNLKAIAGLAKCQIAAGELELAKKTLAITPPKKENDPDIASARALLELAEQPADNTETAELKALVEANPKDHQARLNLALALNKDGDGESAMDHLLTIIAADRGWNDDGARKQLLQFFDAWGFTDPLSVAGRRRLSSLLFS